MNNISFTQRVKNFFTGVKPQTTPAARKESIVANQILQQQPAVAPKKSFFAKILDKMSFSKVSSAAKNLQPQPRPGAIRSQKTFAPDHPKYGCKDIVDLDLENKLIQGDLHRQVYFINGERHVYGGKNIGNNEVLFTKELKNLGLSEGEILVVKGLATQNLKNALTQRAYVEDNTLVASQYSGENLSIVVTGENISVTANFVSATRKVDNDNIDTPNTGVAFMQAKAVIARGVTKEECLEKTTISHTFCEEIPFDRPFAFDAVLNAAEQKAVSAQIGAAYAKAAKEIEGFNEPPLVDDLIAKKERLHHVSPLIRANPLAKSAAITVGNQKISPSATNPVLKMKLWEALESKPAADNLYPFLGEKAIGNHLKEMSTILERDDLRIHRQKWNIERDSSNVVVKVQFDLLSTDPNGKEEVFLTEREITIPINLLQAAPIAIDATIDELTRIFDSITIIDSIKPPLGQPKNTTMYGPDAPENGSKALDASTTEAQFGKDIVRNTFYINGELFVLNKNVADVNEAITENEKIFTQTLKNLGLNDGEIIVVKKMASQGIVGAAKMELHEEGISVARGPSHAPLPQNFSISVKEDKITVGSNWVYVTRKNTKGIEDDSLTFTGVTFVQTQAVIGRGTTKEECLEQTIITQTICEEIPFDRPLALHPISNTEANQARIKIKELTEKSELSASEQRALAFAQDVLNEFEEKKRVLDMETKELHEKGKIAFKQAANTIEGFNEPPLVDPITGNRYFATGQ